MPSNTTSPNAGTARRIEEFLVENIGKHFTLIGLRTELGISPDVSSSYTKIQNLKKKGCLIEKSDGSFIVDESILKHTYSGRQKLAGLNINKNFNGHKPEQQELPTLTPAAFQNMARLETARDAQPLDLGALMQQIMTVDEQNKMYRNALEQIVVIMEQAGIIEKA